MNQSWWVVIGFVAIVVLGFGLILIFGGQEDLQPDQLHRLNHQGDLTPQQGRIYNDHSVVRYDDLWYVQLNHQRDQYNIPLHYPPWAVEDIPYSGTLPESFSEGDVYLTFDPTGRDLNYVALSVAEISLSMGQVLQQKAVAACTKNITETCATRPIVTCENATEPTIYLHSEGNPGVQVQGQCVNIQGIQKDLLRSAERYLYSRLGVI